MTIINKMVQKDHLDGVVLECTELPLILGQEDFKNIQVFDIAQVQIKAAVDQLLKTTPSQNSWVPHILNIYIITLITSPSLNVNSI